MRRNKAGLAYNGFSMLVLDDDVSITQALKSYFQASGYLVDVENDPVLAIERIKQDTYDILLLDFLMRPMCGDEVVKKVRHFNQNLYIVLLTGHKDLAPPLKTIRELDIQGYYEKSDKFDQLELLVEACVKSISQMRIIRKYQDGLNQILSAVPQIYQLQPLDNILEKILLQLMPLANSKDGFILVEFESIHSMTGNMLNQKSIFKGIGSYNIKAADFMEDLPPALIEQIGKARNSQTAVASTNFFVAPLVNEQNESIGVIGVNTGEGVFDKEIIKLFEIYANQVSSAISNAFLHSLVNIKNNELNKTYAQLREGYLETISALRLIVDAKDIYTRGHSDRVAYYAVKIGEAMGLSEDVLEDLKIAGLFHDVGKVGTADDILTKKSSLSPEEFAEIKKHPEKGADILSAISMFHRVVEVVRCHHERWDGSGYPNGLKGLEIPLEARIIAVADSFDAMVSNRQYRSQLSLPMTIKELKKGKGTQFDAEVVDVFLEVLEDYEAIIKELESTFSIVL